MTEGLFWNALAADTRETFTVLASLPVPAEFYLAGGTALALQIGHRISRDLDFFTADNLLEPAERTQLAQALQNVQPTAIRHESNGQLFATVKGVEVSFIHQHHTLLFPTLEANGIQLAQPVDIGLMKLAAIKDRGTRRDFVDLYCLRHVAPLAMMFELLSRKYHDRPDFSVHLAYALSYFEDAEADPRQLQLLQPVNWKAVKQYALDGARLLSKINAGLEPPQRR